MPWKKKETAVAEKPVEQKKIKGSPQQDAIWDELKNGDRNMTVEALAGTGKTFTLVEGLKRIKKGVRAAFVAYNKSIAQELQAKVPSGVVASTMHSMGFSAVKKALGDVEVDQYKVPKLITEELGGSDDKPLRGDEYDLKLVVEKLVSLAKNTLAGDTEPTASNEALQGIITHFGIEVPGTVSEEEAYDLTRTVLKRCAEETDSIDYDDMTWLPVVRGFSGEKYDLLCVDEAQDLNKCRQRLCLNSGERIVIVGDKNQAIYGFSGADVDSIDNMTDYLRNPPGDHDPLGHGTMPLTVTYRCPVSHVERAKRIVPALEARPNAPQGTIVEGLDIKQVLKDVEPGDLLICRTNAPVCEVAFKLLAQKKRVRIPGRDIGQGLLAVLRKSRQQDVQALLSWLGQWRDKEETRLRKKKYVSETQLQQLEDKYQCLIAFSQGCATVDEMTRSINQVFSDTASAGQITCSSIHRAKGLESERVLVLCPELLPAPWAKQQWEKQQEWNLKYVAETRSKDYLGFVPDWRKQKGVDLNTEAGL